MQVRIDPTWAEALQGAFDAPYFAQLAAFVRQEYSLYPCYPPAGLIFNAFNLCPLPQVRVVIIGQDPYHEPGQAHGLCFSVPKGIAVPPSLGNIYKEIESDMGKPAPPDGDLTRWAQQGVLLLNATLTVRQHQAGSHQHKGWEQFTDAVIRTVSDRRCGVAFLLWGSYAGGKRALIDPHKHLVLCSAHPSPLSAYRGFFGNHHFSQVNEYLVRQGQQPIDW